MMDATNPVVGVDVGASTISAGLVHRDGTILTAAQAPTLGEGAVIDTILALIDRTLKTARERDLQVSGIGIGVPGLVDVEKGFLRATRWPGLAELCDVPLAALIQERSGHAVFVDNDVNALSLAEWMFGPGRGASSLVTVAIGPGLGPRRALIGHGAHGHRSRGGAHPRRPPGARPHPDRRGDRSHVREPRRAHVRLRGHRLPRHLRGGRNDRGPGAGAAGQLPDLDAADARRRGARRGPGARCVARRRPGGAP